MMQTANQLRTRLLDSLLLRRAEAKVRNYSPQQHARIRQLCEVASLRMDLADDTTDPRFAAATIPLYCEAIRCLTSALASSTQDPPSLAPLELSDGIQRLEELVKASALPVVPEGFSESISILKTPDLLAIERLELKVAVRRRALVEEFAHWLRSQVEPRTIHRIRFARIVRITALAAGLVALSVWAISTIVAPTNLALNRPVKMSSHFPGTPDPSGATDGKIVGPFQAHTTIEGDPWIAVDLGAIRNISKVVIHNRTDGLYQDALPLVLEFSADGTQYDAVDRRTEMFTGSNPWIFKTRGKTARHVRIHGRPSGYVVVTEIEVFER
jgi:hypothetical protein